MSSLRVLVAVVVAMLTMMLPGSVRGQGAQRKKATPKKILRLEEMKVEGRIQKPQAMFLMPRANLNYDLERSEPLLPKVVGAVDKGPF
jgi:hypothetical protein